MRTTSVFRVSSVLCVLVLCGLMAAERRSPLIGSTRDQVRAKLGEPKSNIMAGTREVLIYPQERVVLRDGVVVEVDALYELSSPRATASATAPAEAAEETAAVAGAGSDPTSTGTAPAKSDSIDPAATAEPAPAAAGQTVTIKSVRPPSRTVTTLGNGTPSTPTVGDSSRGTSVGRGSGEAPPAAEVHTPPATVPAPVVTSVAVPPPALEATPLAPEGPGGAANLPADASATAAGSPSTTPTATPVEPHPAAVAAAATTPPVAEATPRTPLILGGIAAALVALLAWILRQRRQRSLLLEATAVSHPPFTTTPLVHPPSSRFTLDLLQKLEWKRFEELVCAYYNKTGVLAVRTKAGRQNPVHIRISWKGEQRPFACVHCIAHAPMAVDQRPIEALHGALGTEDVRRGYVVTSGKFSPGARESAEERQITLLPGDVFIEKLNALPDAARAELLKDVMTGDYATPSCPTCESKMSRSATDPLVWECGQCGTTMR